MLLEGCSSIFRACALDGGATKITRSKRSKTGPESLERYLALAETGHRQRGSFCFCSSCGSGKFDGHPPQGQRFPVPTRVKRAGSSNVPRTRLSVTFPLSRGSLSASRLSRGHSGNSSAIKSPPCASENSPGLTKKEFAPPISALDFTCELTFRIGPVSVRVEFSDEDEKASSARMFCLRRVAGRGGG